MTNRIGRTLGGARRVGLTAAAAFAFVAPVVVGAVAPSVRAQSAQSATALASPKAPAIDDLAAVIKLMRDPSATAADKERLIGKTYSGIVRVDAVRLYPQASVVMAMPRAVAGGDKSPVIALAFTGKADDEKLQQLHIGQDARLRGTLTKFRMEGKVAWVDFADLVIER